MVKELLNYTLGLEGGVTTLLYITKCGKGATLLYITNLATTSGNQPTMMKYPAVIQRLTLGSLHSQTIKDNERSLTRI